MGVRDLKRVTQTGCKVLGGTAVAPFQKTPRQDAQPQLHVVAPGAMCGRKVEPMLMARSAQDLRRCTPRRRSWATKGPWHHWATRRQPARLPWVLR